MSEHGLLAEVTGWCPCCTGVDHEPGDPDLCDTCADRCGQRCCHPTQPAEPSQTTTQAAEHEVRAAIETAIGGALGEPVRLTGMRRHPNGTLQLTLRPPPRQRPPRKGCPSEAAYRRHLAAGEPTDVCGCREHMRQVEAQRRARHPEWWSSINRSTRATGGAR